LTIIIVNNQEVLIFIIIDRSIIDYCNTIAILLSHHHQPPWQPPLDSRQVSRITGHVISRVVRALLSGAGAADDQVDQPDRSEQSINQQNSH
jgi:hypothetical protein